MNVTYQSTNILLIAYTAQNLGDDMFINCICNKYKQKKFYIVCPYIYAQAFEKLKNLQVFHDKESLLNNFAINSITIDLQIIIGGSLFMEPNDKENINIKIQEMKDERIYDNKPLIIIGANFGPYESFDHFSGYYDWFKSVSDICFRDQYSYSLFQDLQNVRYAPDVIFNYNLPQISKKNKVISISCIKHNGRIGLSDYDESKYIEFLSFLSLKYLDLGFQINLLSFCSKQGDTIMANELMANLNHNGNVRIIEYTGDIDGFLSKLIESEFIICTRFHAMIIALKSNIPIFPIIYNCKTFEAIKSYKFEGNYAFITELDNLSFDNVDYNRIQSFGISDKVVIESLKQFHYLENELYEKREYEIS